MEAGLHDVLVEILAWTPFLGDWQAAMAAARPRLACTAADNPTACSSAAVECRVWTAAAVLSWRSRCAAAATDAERWTAAAVSQQAVGKRPNLCAAAVPVMQPGMSGSYWRALHAAIGAALCSRTHACGAVDEPTVNSRAHRAACQGSMGQQWGSMLRSGMPNLQGQERACCVPSPRLDEPSLHAAH